MRVLYVEDNRINALLFEEALKLEPDIELRVAEDGTQALAVAGEWQPDLLVIDSHLPDTSGGDLLPKLRALPGMAEVRAVMCSADAQPEDEQAARAQGFADYWLKPIDIPRLLADLRALRR
jgi:CheY-like chemotaxis protein